MSTRAGTLVAFIAALAATVLPAAAGPLKHAEVNKIVNEVRVVEPRQARSRPAKLRDVIKDDLAVRTGAQSRAELLFQDQTLTRLGAETLFSFQTGTRDMTLDRGTMLLQVPKGRGGAKIRTAAVTAAITGTTIMIENLPGKHVKVVVLEGSLRLSLNGKIGESVVLNPGRMVIVGAKDRQMPRPVAVDLEKLVKTSALVNPDKFRGKTRIKVEPLPSMDLIQKEIVLQARAKSSGQLAETNLLIQGDGAGVIVASKETMAAVEAVVNGNSDQERNTAVDYQSKPPNAVAKIIEGAAGGDLVSVKADVSDRGGIAIGAGLDGDRDGSDSGSIGSGGTSSGGGNSGSGGGSGGGLSTPLDPIVAPIVDVVTAPVGPVTGVFTPPVGNTVDVVTDIVAPVVDLTGVTDSIQVGGSVTADSVTFDAGSAVQFDATVQADVIDGVGAEIGFSSPVGAVTITLDAPVVSASSLTAVNSLLVTGTLKPLLSADLLVRAPLITIAGGIDAVGAGNSALPLLSGQPGAGGVVILEADALQIGATGIAGINASGGDASLTSLTAGGSGGAVYLGTQANPVTGDVTVNQPITATTGSNGLLTRYGGTGGTVSVTANGTIDVQSSIKVSDNVSGRASRNGGQIRLESRRTSGVAINVGNSSQIASLLDAATPGKGGRIEFVSAGGDINVNGGTVRADKGTVEIRNNGAGNITLANANLRGDVVKANVLGANGQLIIGGGSIDANSAIKLYASGANGAVVFNDNVSLNGSSVKTIAGRTVTILDGKVVTVNGSSKARVFTDNPNYTGSGGNGTTTGRFGGQGATTKSFGERPAF